MSFEVTNMQGKTPRIDADVVKEIDARLDALERTEQVKVQFASESGSRGWGFESSDSDYDVRFIYIRPSDFYLSTDLERKRDVIELPIEGLWDINGWDLRKALQLFFKSNPPLLEWLSSPIIYREASGVIQKLRDLAPEYYSPKACSHHYWNMVTGHYRKQLAGQRVPLKRFFYILRPLLAMQWLEEDMGVVPMEFEKLVEGTIRDQALKNDIEELVAVKRTGLESGFGPRFSSINRFVEGEMRRREGRHSELPAPDATVDRLNALFRESMGEAWDTVDV
jgi:predicted nucleotidyltransferase